MHFGRVDSLVNIDLSIPSDSVRTKRFLALTEPREARIYVGCPIWSSKKWVGSLYPEGTKPSAYLARYADRFKTVEINSTFYHLLEPERLILWREEVPRDFRFCPKVFRGITEKLMDTGMPDLVARFSTSVRALADRLGVVFAQFPESLGPRQAPLLARFVDAWPRDLPLAVELRHPGWFQNHALHDETVDFFYRHGIATVMTDTPGRRDVLHTSLTQPRVVIRFQGNELHASDRERLAHWADRLALWSKSSLEEIYFFTHQPEDDHIPQTAEILLEELTKRGVSAVQGTPGKTHRKEVPLFSDDNFL